jgi:menaquinol-cytochrome c reductase iron-sulfur subunit
VAGTDDENVGHGPEGEGHGAPRPSIWPFAFALGIALVLIGVVLNWVVFGIGVGIAALSVLALVFESGRGRRRAAAAQEPAEDEHEEEEERYGRNVFLERTTLGLGAVIGGAVTVPIVGFAIAPTFIDQHDRDVNLGPLSNFPENQWRVAQFVSVDEVGERDVSRRTAFIRNNGLKDDQPSLTIISNRCVHLGCPTQPGKTETDQSVTVEVPDHPSVILIPTQPATFTCPCHGGSYDLEGNRIAGPPVRSLDRYLYSIIDGNVVLGKRVSVGIVTGTGADAMIKSYTRFDPGEHVDGPDVWMYPASPQGI